MKATASRAGKTVALALAGTLSLAWVGSQAGHLVAQVNRGAADSQAVSQDKADQDESVERGRYLVHHVAMCIYCHTPHDERGRLQRSSLLEGATVPVESPFPAQQWAFRAPKLAGLPAGFSEQDVAHLLQTGQWLQGGSPRPPMPDYRMKRQDAEAVAAYLKSLR